MMPTNGLWDPRAVRAVVAAAAVCLAGAALAESPQQLRQVDGTALRERAAQLADSVPVAPPPEGGAANQGRASNMFLVDGADGGTIYLYNFELRQIVRTCPTPEPADGVSADGLAVANDRGSLFYTNANGTKLIYELDINDCSVKQTFDSAVTSGGTSSGSMSTILGLGYGVNNDPFRRDFRRGNVVYQAGSGDASTDRIRAFDPDDAGFGWVDSVSLGGGGWEGTVGADPRDPATLADSLLFFPAGATGTIYGQGFGGLTLVFEYNFFTFADYWFPEDLPTVAAGQGFVSRRTDRFDPQAREDREYHSSLAPDDRVYEYDGSIAPYPGEIFLRTALQAVFDPTPGDQVSAIGVDELDSDFDGIHDFDDTCPGVRSSDTTDSDLDGVFDHCDNCPEDPNPGQLDADRDGAGDACDFFLDPLVLPDHVLFLVDGFEGGTIYEYDPEAGVVVNSFPTPELNTGMGQGLGYSQRRGELFYTNGTGRQPTLYRLDPATGSVRSSALQADVLSYLVVGLGAGQIGSIDGEPFGGGDVFVYTDTEDRGDGFGQIIIHDPDTFAFLTGAGIGGSSVGQAAVAGSESNANEPFTNGIAYFTRNGNGDFSGENRIDALSWDPFGIGGRRFPSPDGPSGAVGVGLGFDGDTLYLSKATVDGLFTYDLLEYFEEFGVSMGLFCDGGENDGLPCQSNLDCPGACDGASGLCGDGVTACASDFDCDACVDASVRANAEAGFLPDPTPGAPITAVAAGLADADFDGVPNRSDNCPTVPNPEQEDLDVDGTGDACDNCPAVFNPEQEESEVFDRFDGVGDACDNCPALFNPGQEDDDDDGEGNVCDFPEGFVDDSDALDDTFGSDVPAPPAAIDITKVEARLDLCDFDCMGGPDLCCGRRFGEGEEAMVIELTALGSESGLRLDQGTFEAHLDFGERESVGGELRSILDTVDEPGLAGHQTEDVILTAMFGQSATRRGGGRLGAGNVFNGLARVENLSTVDQLAGTIDFVFPMAELIATANPEERAASGLDVDPLGSVSLALWYVSRAEGNRVDRAPNTNDNGHPTIASEVSRFAAKFREVNPEPAVVDFRGTNACTGGDADAVVVGGGTATSFVTLVNPSFMPMEVTGIDFTDPQFSALAGFPLVIPELGGRVAVSVAFEPAAVGAFRATATVLSDDPDPSAFELVGDGVPDEPPALGSCSITPGVVLLGQAPIITVEVSDSATLANIEFCTATGSRVAGGTPRTVLLDLVDDFSVVGDLPCDGVFTQTRPTGGLFSRGVWEFTFSCRDRQGNVTTAAATCGLEVQ